VNFLQRNGLGLVLAAFVLGEAWLAWQQGRELSQLRSRAAEHARAEAQLAAARKAEAGVLATLAATHRVMGDPLPGGSNAPESRRNFNADFRTALDDPKFRSALSVVQQGRMVLWYGPLFKSLKLPPDQLERLKGLIADAQLAKSDSIYAAADQGAQSSPTELLEAAAAAQKETNDKIHALLGDAGFGQLQEYNQTRFLHVAVSQMQQSLSYTATPLSDEQANQLVNVLYQATPVEQRPDPTGYMAQVGAFTDPNSFFLRAALPAQANPAAQAIMSAPQMQVLQEMEQGQQIQQQIGQLWRAAHPAPSP
jgi:hypothetical protein